jgi:L-lactate dehydrogenase
MTAVAAKIAGPSIPPGRIFGSGTCLDSSRLRSLISKKLDLDTSAVTGFVIGEHGDTSVPVWSSVSIGGVPLLSKGQEPGKIHEDMHREVVDSAYDVIAKKGYTNWVRSELNPLCMHLFICLFVWRCSSLSHPYKSFTL